MNKKLMKLSAVVAMALFSTPMASAQSLGDILSTVSNVANKVTDGKTTDAALAGTWTYQSPAVEFKSNDLLKKAGGSLISSKVEKKVNPYLTKVGLVAGKATFTFNSDKTFKYKVSNKNTGSGKWSLNGNVLTLTYTGKLSLQQRTVTCFVKQTGNQMELLFDADKLMTFLNNVGAYAATYSKTISTVKTILGTYDGMQLGLKFKK